MRDPSVPWLYSGCLIIVLGTMIAFVFTYREVWVWHDEGAGMLCMATRVRGSSPRAHREFETTARALAALGSSAAPGP